MKVRTSKNVFRDLGFRPAEAKNLRIRATLMVRLSEHIQRSGMPPKEAAEIFGVTKLRISDLMRGKIEVFCIETLTAMLARMKVNTSIHIGQNVSDP